MNKALQDQIVDHLDKYPEALQFLKSFEELCHGLDDLIDRDNPDITDYRILALDVWGLAVDIYSSAFYLKNISWLYPLIKNKHRIFSSSVVWEKEEGWKGHYADVLRCGGDTTLVIAMLDHVCHVPVDELRQIDAAIREDAWVSHHDSKGFPI